MESYTMWIQYISISVLLLTILFGGQVCLVATQCTSTRYEIITSGLATSNADATLAKQGLPFLPECEESNRKYFRVKSDTPVALYLSVFPHITDPTTHMFYQIDLQSTGIVQILRDGVSKASGSSPVDKRLSGSDFVDLYVSYTQSDGTIRIGVKDGNEITSWTDTAPIDVNFILVQKYNDPTGSEAVFEFCDGALKLLSRDPAVVTDQIAQDPDYPNALAENAIDGETNDGIFDEDVCIAIDDSIQNFAWLRIDLQDMYDIKAVTMVNSQKPEFVCPLGWQFFGRACYFEGITPMTWDDAQDDCYDKGGALVAIRMEEIRDFLVSWLDNTEDYWIGLKDDDPGDGGDDHELEWVAEDGIQFGWTDGGPNDHHYDDFEAGEPDVTGAKCVMMSGSASLQWNDESCSNTKKYVCQKSLCPIGFRLLGLHCYYSHPNIQEEYEDAQATCESKGAYLPTIENAYVQGIFTDWFPSSYAVWIGLNDLDTYTTEDKFIWVEDPSTVVYSGGAAQGSVYTNWFTSQPDDWSGADCVVIQLSLKAWDDQECTSNYHYACQAPPAKQATQLIGADVRVGSCDHMNPPTSLDALDTIKLNTACPSSISAAEVDVDRIGYWLLRECDADYYGQYVYILKEDSDAWFSLCEVEVWGKEIDFGDKPKVGFTRQTVSEFEKSLASQSPFTFNIKRTGGSSTNPTCAAFDLEQMVLTPQAVKGATDGTESVDFDYTFITPSSYTFTPTDSEDLEFEITVHNDLIPAEDELFGFKLTALSKGLPTKDEAASLYGNITFTILNDDVLYCWKDSRLSVYEDTRTATATLVRTGYQGGTTTAYIRTQNDDTPGANLATAGQDYYDIPSGTEIEFATGVPEVEVPFTILEDDICEVIGDTEETFKLQIESAPGGTICSANMVIVEILDDVMFRFQQTSYTVSESQGKVEVLIELLRGPLDIDVVADVKSQPITSSSTVSANQDDYTAVDARLTIPAGQATASLNVTVVDDNIVEDDYEAFQLVIVKNPFGLLDCLQEADDVANILIEDDDCCWSVHEDKLTVREDVGDFMLAIKCERDERSAVTPGFPLTANLRVDTTDILYNAKATSDDFSVPSTVVTIDARNSPTANVQVIIADDDEEEETEYFAVTLSSVSDGELCGPLTTTVAIENNEATVRITSCGDDNTIFESGGHVPVTLERTGDLTRTDSVVLFTTAITAQPDRGDGSGDYSDTNVEISFPVSESIVVHDIIIKDDTEEENDENFVIQIKKQSPETHLEDTLDMCTVTVIDDDCTFFISSPKDIVNEGADLTLPITISRMGYTDRTARVYVEASGLNGEKPNDATPDKDYVFVSTFLTFRAGETTVTVDLAINDDDKAEFIEYLQLSLSDADCSINGVNRLIIEIHDSNDGLFPRAIAGIAFGVSYGVIGIAAILAAFYWLARRNGLQTGIEREVLQRRNKEQLNFNNSDAAILMDGNQLSYGYPTSDAIANYQLQGNYSSYRASNAFIY